MKRWFESLEPRERLFVTAAAAVLACAFFYLAVWLPLDKGQKDMRAGIELWRESLAELRTLGPGTSSESGGNRPPDADRSLVVVVDTTLREFGLYSALQRSQPGNAEDIRVELRNAPFDDLVLWLGHLGQNYGLQVQSASVLAASEANDGAVNSTLTLER